jgi:DNA mismatch repair protein MutS2
MAFTVTQKTLERLEWPQILARLSELAYTPKARTRIEHENLFEERDRGVRERLRETREARALIENEERPPLSGVVDLADALQHARKGGVLAGRELLDLAHTLAALRGTARFLSARAERAESLADLAAMFSDQRALEDEIEACLDPAGEVRDSASPALASARRETNRLAAEIQSKLDRILRNSNVSAALSDHYFTVRNDRYVLPVRADARGQVRGIVHDASGSGTTLFIEPEALVELNNRLKQAEILIEQEIARVLRELSSRAAEIAPLLDAELTALASIDLAFARAGLAVRLDCVDPEVGDEGVFVLPQLRHPMLDRESAVPNDVRLGEGFQVLVISGPNAGGKTVTMKAVALAALFVRAGLQVPASAGARVDLVDAILADIGDEQSIGENLSTFSAHMANIASIVDTATQHSLVVLDEVGVGTDPSEGAALAQAILETLAESGARVITTTHYSLLKEMADADTRFANASVEFDPETLAPTYRLRMGFPGTSSAAAVAARMGLSSEVLERAQGFLEREDRQLDRMLVELADSRAALESEQREARRLRQETEATRSEYRKRLERLQERRDKLYREMREDLDRAFRDAHGQIAGVIRDLQRRGTAQEAARAREHLQKIESRSREVEQEVGVHPTPEDQTLVAVDWRNARPGDPVQIRGGAAGTLQALPDKRGKVAVSMGTARVMVPMERVGRPGDAPTKRKTRPAPAALPPAPPSEGRCDLRGQRVDEALDRLGEFLDDATRAGRDRLLVVHGIGSGALRRAVRDYLSTSAYVAGIESAGSDSGGDGATLALLR